MKNHLITILLFLISELSVAQDGNIKGYVYDYDNKSPVSNVAVIITRLSKTVETDHNGYYELNNMPEGNYTITYKLAGYRTKNIDFKLSPGETKTVNAFISLKPTQLNEVIISEEMPGSKKEIHPVEHVNKVEIEQQASRDIGDYLRNIPNISGIRKGGGAVDPVIRGFKYKQLGVIINGGTKIEGGCPNRMDPAVAHIDIDDIEHIEVYKGPYALRFGPAFGGYINLSTIKPFPGNEFQTNIKAIKGFESNWGGNKEHLMIKGGNRNIYFVVTANHKKYGNYKSGNGEEISSGFTKYNYTGKLGISPAKNHSLLFSFKRSYGRNVMFPALPMDERSDDTHLSNIDYSITRLSKTVKRFTVKLYNSNVHHIMDNKERPFSDTVVAVSDIKAINRGGRMEIEGSTGDNHFIAGLDFEYISKDGQRTKNFILQPGLPVKAEDLWNDAEINNTGLYLTFDRTSGPVNLYLSARVDRNAANSGLLQLKNMSGDIIYTNDKLNSEFINLSINAGASYYINGKTSIGLSLGRGVRSPDMTERFIILLPIGYDRYDYLGNPELKPEVNNEIDLKVNYNNQDFYLSATTFFSYVSDYITAKEVPPSQVKPQTKDVLGVKQFYNADHVYLYGFEFIFKYENKSGTQLTSNAAVTYGINPEATKYIIENGQVTREEKVKNDPLPEIPPLEANLGFKQKVFNNKLIPGLNIRFVTRQHKISEAFYEEETPGFALLDLNLAFKYNKNLKVTSGVNNLFNKAYYEHLNRRIIGSNMPLFEPGRVFFINFILTI